jgi:hypothetical protein
MFSALLFGSFVHNSHRGGVVRRAAMDGVSDAITILGEPYDIPEPQESLQVRGPWPSGRKLVARRKLESVADFKLRIEADAMVVAVR